jgi:hypothetical protein
MREPMNLKLATMMRRLTLVLLLSAPAARAADHFLTIGGGYSPSGNQVSLEKNVLFFRNVLADVYAGNASPGRHDVFFSDGDAPGRDVQYDDPANPLPEAYRLLARLADAEDDLGYRYRNHQLTHISGPATGRDIKRWFADVGAKIPGGDRLFIYVTGHGGYDEDEHGAKRYENNHIELWNHDSLEVRELAELLDKLPQGVNVVVVMVQCYSGGFADLVFAGGQSDRPPARAVRCGFFSTMPDRQAAGCTANINEAEYQDYSTSFWAAIRGRTRTGVDVPRETCDFDRDGIVSFAEAHAHVLLTDDSIDVPMTTSDRFLRLKSDPGASRGSRLVSAEDMLDRLNALATPAERAVIDGLSKQLALGGQYRYKSAKDLADSLRESHKLNKEKQDELEEQLDDVRDDIWDNLELRWPELHNRWDPAVDRMLREEGDELVRSIKSDKRFAEFDRLYVEHGELSSKDDALEAKWARCTRLVHMLERVALAHNIEKVAEPTTLERYQSLVAAENGTLGSGKPAAR